MVLDQECTDIAEGLGLNIALDEFPEAGAAVDIRATLLACALPKSPNRIVPCSFLHLLFVAPTLEPTRQSWSGNISGTLY